MGRQNSNSTIVTTKEMKKAIINRKKVNPLPDQDAF